MKNFNIPSLFFTVCFIFILFLMWLMIKPLFGALIFAGILAGSFYPLFNRIDLKLKGKRKLAAVLTCAIIMISVLLPAIYIIINLSKETVTLYGSIKNALSEEAITQFLQKDGWIATTANTLGIDLSLESLKPLVMDKLQGLSSILFSIFNSWVENILGFLFNFVIMILAIFAIFVEGPRLKEYLLDLSPLPNDQEQLIIDKFNQMNYVTLVCNGIGGVIQGVLAGIAFAIVGVPSIILWTFVMVVLAFIPLLGISIVYIPVSIYFLIIGKVGAGLFLLIFCSAVALLTENWFKPFFIGKRIQMNSLFILFCIIGGMGVFGMAGIFYGPIIGIIFLTAVEIYHAHYSTIED